MKIKLGQDLTTGRITGKLLLFALPLMVGNVLQQFYNLVDTWVVGKFIGAAGNMWFNAGVSGLYFHGDCGDLFIQLFCKFVKGGWQFLHSAGIPWRFCSAECCFRPYFCGEIPMGCPGNCNRHGGGTIPVRHRAVPVLSFRLQGTSGKTTVYALGR